MIEDYIEYIRTIRRYSPRTVAIYSDTLEEFRNFAQATDDLSSALNVNMLRMYEVWMLDNAHLSARTVALHLSVLSGYCRYLVKKGVLKSNPVRMVSKPRTQKRLPEFYRRESIEAYFEQTKGVPEYGSAQQKLSRLIVSILFNTGIRRAELIDLNISSVDLGRGVLRVRGKGDKMREIPMVLSLCEEISLYLQSVDTTSESADSPDGPLLRTPRGGRLYPVFIDRVIKQELGNVGGITTRKSPHVLRHTLATELLDGGSDLNSIKEMLGHSSLAATQVYTHNSVEKLKSVYINAHPRAKNGGKNGN